MNTNEPLEGIFFAVIYERLIEESWSNGRHPEQGFVPDELS